MNATRPTRTSGAIRALISKDEKQGNTSQYYSKTSGPRFYSIHPMPGVTGAFVRETVSTKQTLC
jgi:hypothetical protein